MAASTKSKAKPKPTARAGRAKTASKKAPARKPAGRTAPKARASSSKSEDQYMSYSGKFTVRLPRSLHQALVDRAEREGVSLNLFVTNALSRTVAVAGARGKK